MPKPRWQSDNILDEIGKSHHVIRTPLLRLKPNYSINYRFFELECKLERNVKLPKCVTIVGILMIINGAILIGGAVFTIYFVPILIGQITEIMEGNLTSNLGNLTVNFGNLSDSEQIRSPQLVATITNTIATIAMVVAAIGIAIGIACFLLALGLFRGNGWAWIITVILVIISIIFSVVAIGSGGFVNIINIIISGIILYYLYRPTVKAYFGRGQKISK
jgi:hypothetical protein